jgi:uncharacterized protein YaiL (DUF2058 family)
MASLQDQLMKLGLTNAQKVKQAKTEKSRKAKQKKKKGTVEVSDVQVSINQQKAQQYQKDLLKNKATQCDLEARSDHGKLLQMIAQHSEKDYQGEIDHHFIYDGKIKRIAVNDKTQKNLVNGQLAICVLNGKFYLINKEASEQLIKIDETVLVALHEKVDVSQVSEDDPYAEFSVPDDLIW